MRINLEKGVFSGFLGSAGGTAMFLWPEKWLGAFLLATAFAILVGGIRLDGRPWWRRRTPDMPKMSPQARLQIRDLREGTFDGIQDQSDRPFLKSKKIGKLSVRNASFGGGDDTEKK